MTATAKVHGNTGRKIVPLWGRRRLLPVDPTDRRVVYTFTRGQCHSFAFAMHELTGWPVYLLCSDYVWNDDDDGPTNGAEPVGDPESWGHAVVMAPSGQFVDIEGAWYLDENDSWSDSYPVLVETPEQAIDLIEWSCDEVVTPKAKPFAAAVLSNIRLPA